VHGPRTLQGVLLYLQGLFQILDRARGVIGLEVRAPDTLDSGRHRSVTLAQEIKTHVSLYIVYIYSMYTIYITL
jgi:hypothetical protein